MQTIKIYQRSMEFRGKEAYKALRTNIQFSGENVKVITMTSCMPNEGKSSVSMNLAISLSEAGRRVLFIDTDMRKSVIQGRYKIKNVEKGLSHYLSGQCSSRDIIYATNVEKLHMILAGPIPPNPAELLENKKFREFIEAVREIYDYVIIDSPPIGSVVDSVIAGRISDGVVLIAAWGEVSYKFAQRIKKQLEMSECKILGVVLNKVDMNNKRYYGQYYENYYADEE